MDLGPYDMFSRFQPLIVQRRNAMSKPLHIWEPGLGDLIGRPEKMVNPGEKQIYMYKDLKITS
jgi:hypothetical protein